MKTGCPETGKGLFVTGTDTGVGKSLVACALVRLLRRQGVDAVGFKPVATGAVEGFYDDAEALFEASARSEPLERICPIRLALPLAPTLAAKAEGRAVDLGLAREAFSGLRGRHEALVVEGVGGLLAPLSQQELVVDFARWTALPVVVVCRAGLGTINHTLLTLRELLRAGLPLAGVVLNTTCAADGELAAGAKEEIERLGGRKLLAILPFLSAVNLQAPGPALERAVELLASQVDARSLLG
jgi:dethiobiotin synthetase